MDNSFANRAKIEALKAGATFNNNELCNLFQCSPQGGMRRLRRTNTLVLIEVIQVLILMMIAGKRMFYSIQEWDW